MKQGMSPLNDKGRREEVLLEIDPVASFQYGLSTDAPTVAVLTWLLLLWAEHRHEPLQEVCFQLQAA